ncbi:hypothetical protein CRE_19893 [Caenorhabditis remanei]|uniref:Peptidase A2 domain-containing protein n=1 Tax=Caenorhabditis remanei TaxID=31234 RepID=E3N304_CAERE|nr:hypothetical protein CRE_19893 [Caenorhabditis remanei]
MAPSRSAPPRSARQRIGTIQSYVTNFDKQLDKIINGARLWQRDQKVIRDQEASEGCQQHAVDRVHAPRIAESLQRMLQQVGELPVLLGNKVSDAKSKAFESGSDPEEVESLGLALVSSYAPILNEKKAIIADLLTILTAYTVSYELNVSVPVSPEEILEEMERSFEESSLQEEEKELSPPLSSVSPTPSTSPPTHPNHTPQPETNTNEEYNSAHPQPHQIPETPILMTTGGNFHNQENTRTSGKISDNYFNANFRNPNVQQLFDNTRNYSTHLPHHAQRQPNNTEYSKLPEHSAYRGNSQDARKTQNPDNNPTRSKIHNTEYYSNQQQFPHNYQRFSNESNQQLDSEVNKNIEAAISQQRPATCELCEGRHHLSTCTVDKDTLRRYCVNTETADESEKEENNTSTPEPKTQENFSLLSLYDNYEETDDTVAINHIVETIQNKTFNPTKLPSSSQDIRLPFTLLSTTKDEKILALVDTGAAISLISERSAKRLGLQTVQNIQLSLAGVTGSSNSPCNIYQITFVGDSIEFNTYVQGIPNLPSTKYRKPNFSTADKQTLRNMKINYKHVTPNEKYDNTRMDMILGNDILPHFIRGSQRICLPSGKYIELGPFAAMTFPNAKHCPVMDHNMIPTEVSTLEDSHPPSINVLMSQKYGTDSDDELTNLILQLWQTENCGIESATMLESEYLTQEYLLQLFEKEIVTGEDGLLYVALPWNGKQDRMGNNKSLAYRRLTCLIEKLRRNPELLKAYNLIIEEQLEAGIIEIVTPEMKNQGPEYFAPQNAVFKENSTNTKVRIVGDSSSKQRDTLSLNDCLYEGPNMLKTAPGILLRHREKKYPAVGDIARALYCSNG